MKRVFETAELEAVRNSIIWELRYEKHENQMKGCGVKLRVRDLQTNLVRHSMGSQWSCLRRSVDVSEQE